AIARDGAEAMLVRYTPRPAVVDAGAALAEGASLLHEGVARNRAFDWECGDAAATARAIASAAHVTRLTLLDNRIATCFMGPRSPSGALPRGAARCSCRSRACTAWPITWGECSVFRAIVSAV